VQRWFIAELIQTLTNCFKG